jgi:amino acid transporter
MQYCPHCGERVEVGDRYCIECGTPLGGEAEGAEGTGRTPGARNPAGHERDRNVPRGGTDRLEMHSKVESFGTLWAAVAAGVLAVLESGGTLVLALFYEQTLREQAADVGVESLPSDMTVFVATSAIGFVLAVVVLGLCGYFYREGYLDRRFYWGLVAAGAGGLLVAGTLTLLLAAIVGAYGLLVALRGQNPPQGTDSRGRDQPRRRDSKR